MQIWPVRDSQTFLIDTPGFDDATRKDSDILQSIASCLADLHEGLIFDGKQVNLSSIIYIHPINQQRMMGTSMKNLNMFQHLVGKDNMQHCVLVTSKWGLEDADVAEARERELTTDTRFWKQPLESGATMRRYRDSQQSALEIVKLAIRKGMFTPQLAREYILQKKELYLTSAGRALDEEIAKLREEHDAELLAAQEEHDRATRASNAEATARMEALSSEMAQKLQILDESMIRLRMTRAEAQQRADEDDAELMQWENGSAAMAQIKEERHEAHKLRAFRWFGRFAAMGTAVMMSVLTHGVMAPVGVTIVLGVEALLQEQKGREQEERLARGAKRK